MSMNETGSHTASSTGPVPTEAYELIRPYLQGETDEEENEFLEDLIDGDAKFAKEVEKRRWLLKKMDNVYGGKKIAPDFQETAGRKLAQPVAAAEAFADDDYDDEELEPALAAAPVSFMDSLSAQFGTAPWWLISGAFHGLLLLLVTLITMAIMRESAKDQVIVTELVKEELPEKIEEPVKRDIIPKPIDVEPTEIETDQPQVVTHEEVEIAEMVETPDDSDAADARGEDGISDVFLGGTGSVAAMGLGGGGGGAFGRPNGAGGRLRRAVRGGGSKKTESAVEKALEWLAKHQEADGSWSVRKTEGAGDWDPGVTGLAVLAFLGAGHSEKIGKYKGVVQKGIAWIKANQRADGAIGTDPKFKEHHGGYGYHHAICGMALAEAGAMSRIPDTLQAAQRSINYSSDKYQHGDESDKLAWRYQPKAAKADISVSGWFVMQLKSAKVAGLGVNPASFEGALKLLDSRMADPVNVKKTGGSSYDTGGHRYGYLDKTPRFNTTSIGILCRLFTGSKPEEVQGAARWLLETNPPAWRKDLGVGNGGGWPMYYMYYTTLTMFQIGGDIWKEWNQGLKTVLLANQRRGGDEDGSWDPLSPWEIKAGRAYTTALGAMSLEVYYRYMPLYRGK